MFVAGLCSFVQRFDGGVPPWCPSVAAWSDVGKDLAQLERWMTKIVWVLFVAFFLVVMMGYCRGTNSLQKGQVEPMFGSFFCGVAFRV